MTVTALHHCKAGLMPAIRAQCSNLASYSTGRGDLGVRAWFETGAEGISVGSTSGGKGVVIRSGVEEAKHG